MSPYLLHVSTIVAAVFAATLPVYVQGKKPVAGKPGAQKPSAVKKAASPAGPIFLGTTQLPGDFGKLATTYTIGKSKPINFTLKNAEYSVDSLTIGTRTWVPKGDEKLLLLRYTIHNPLPQEQPYDWSAIKFTAADAKDVNHVFIQGVTRDGESEPLGVSLKPAQKIDVLSAIIVPAEGVVSKLIVERERDAPVIRYDLRGQARSLPTLVTDSADATGASVRKEILVPVDTFVPLGVFDARLDEVTYTTEPLVKREPPKGGRFVVTTFTLKNRIEEPQSYYWGYFNADLRDADGEKVKYTQALLKGNRDERAQGDLTPGEETRVRLFFPLPEHVPGKTLSLSEGKGVSLRAARAWTFDLTGTAAQPIP
ncbi:MAG: DUF4352 domain-containing protein [Akkermansiaceae bacterium]|nr:DUF4352 domain-containing protein [Armatimonadota bacterium]